MPFQDFREFLDALRSRGELIDVTRPVALELEVAKAMRKSASVNGPAVVFRDNGTRFPLVGGVYNSRAKALIAYGCDEDAVMAHITEGLGRRIPPVLVEDAPVHENVILGDDIDLTTLPVPRYSPDDGGPYITPGIVVSRDPDTGVPDIGHYRFEVIDSRTLSFLAMPNHRFGKHIAKAVARGDKTFRAALVIGVDPMLAYTGPIQVPDDTNDFEVAGGLRGAAVELVRCRTIDLEVPARAEFVIEFEVDFTQTVFEGPLGEYTGYYTPGSMKPIARPLALTHRNDPYFQALLTGKPTTENHVLKQLAFEASFLKSMRTTFPTIERVAIPPSGGVNFRVVMAMRPRFTGEARNAILTAMGSNVRPKTVIVVDPDIDVQDPGEVEWAIAFRSQPARDVIIVDGLPGGPLDPTLDESLEPDRRTGSALGIDATYPYGTVVKIAGDACGPSLAEHGAEFVGHFTEVADVPGWREYDFPELAP
ncbi:UbiD family decarboxylase [Mycolicibacterium arseniciresistens]|jgi:4-hydroxy-3-polyprenylbenzoate decarboxylase/2,5-furandicarboxylate decarboxylase 1|uniref:UbiD family decarboxylase n=1 Tax=Mycolicibacterium arseniciresistens TaxID=3062257 RepID=A0ABT8UHH5_9MYCO|nr:UbiD family decarboxylase [Mycolicibacterium arseniciresistens]MDO3637238.1 UbiD family decarboxylase [Mycolicibacterium arseniciresistens]